MFGANGMTTVSVLSPLELPGCWLNYGPGSLSFYLFSLSVFVLRGVVLSSSVSGAPMAHLVASLAEL